MQTGEKDMGEIGQSLLSILLRLPDGGFLHDIRHGEECECEKRPKLHLDDLSSILIVRYAFDIY